MYLPSYVQKLAECVLFKAFLKKEMFLIFSVSIVCTYSKLRYLLVFFFRLGTKSVFASLSRLPATLNTAQYATAAGAPKLTFKKFESETQVNHEERNELLKRPLSPHLTIYKFPFPAVLSISHRATGKRFKSSHTDFI